MFGLIYLVGRLFNQSVSFQALQSRPPAYVSVRGHRRSRRPPSCSASTAPGSVTPTEPSDTSPWSWPSLMVQTHTQTLNTSCESSDDTGFKSLLRLFILLLTFMGEKTLSRWPVTPEMRHFAFWDQKVVFTKVDFQLWTVFLDLTESYQSLEPAQLRLSCLSNMRYVWNNVDEYKCRKIKQKTLVLELFSRIERINSFSKSGFTEWISSMNLTVRISSDSQWDAAAGTAPPSALLPRLHQQLLRQSVSDRLLLQPLPTGRRDLRWTGNNSNSAFEYIHTFIFKLLTFKCATDTITYILGYKRDIKCSFRCLGYIRRR